MGQNRKRADQVCELQIVFAFLIHVFRGPDTDLDNVRNRVIEILLGVFVTAFVFNYIFPRARLHRTAILDQHSGRFASP